MTGSVTKWKPPRLRSSPTIGWVNSVPIGHYLRGRAAARWVQIQRNVRECYAMSIDLEIPADAKAVRERVTSG